MILAINCLQLIGTAEILSGRIRENMDLAINCLAIIEIKQSTAFPLAEFQSRIPCCLLSAG